MANSSREQDIQQLISLLRNDKAFANFSDEEIAEFASRADFASYEQGEKIIRQGEKGHEFFVIISGQLRAIDINESPPRLLNYHATGDIVGVRALLRRDARAATVEVVTSARLAIYHADSWDWLLNTHPQIETYFEELEHSLTERAINDFPGRQSDEVVVAATKRHVLAFIATLHWPLGLLIIPVLFLIAASLLEIPFPTLLNGPLGLLAILPFVILAFLVTLYNYVDWRNDDFIVTTKRVIHIERILFYGEQRHEAPLTRIQDVTIFADFFDQFFDADDIQIKTAGAGVIQIKSIRQANYIRQVIFQEQERAKARVAAANIAAVRQNIARRLNWEDVLEKHVMEVAEPEGTIIKRTETRHYPAFIDYFLPRVKEVNQTKDGAVIIWRKHYYVLLTHITLPLLTLLTLFYLLTASFLIWFPFSGFLAVSLFIKIGLGLAIMAALVWYLWEYDGWRKDFYMVTNSRIIDVEGSPFGLQGEKRTESTFENIQNTFYDIPNFLSNLLNMGNVVVETAGKQSTFTFRQVFNPSEIQEEIFNRMALSQQRKREQERDTTTGQVVRVLGEYHYLATKAASTNRQS